MLSGDDSPEQHAAWRERGTLPGQSGLFSALARELEGPVALLLGVPNEPLGGLRGDALLASTLAEFLATRDADTPLLMPMVKSAVRALDAVQELARRELGLQLDTFTLAGASKRAWTAWLTAAIDARVTALVPLAMDALHMGAQLRHQRAVWGEFSPALRDYSERGVLAGLLDAPDARALLDPWEYRSALGLPKLTVAATNDSLYPCDSLPLYWDDMPGPKHVLYLPNQDHDLGEHASLPGSLRAFHAAAQGRAGLPQLAWIRRESGRGVELVLESSEPPAAVRHWTAESSTRDLRLSPWTAHRLAGDGRRHIAQLAAPARGHVAHYLEAVFARSPSPLHLCTPLAVVAPDGRIVSPGRRDGGAP